MTAIFGGVELKVPSHWKVSVKGIPILGGFEDTTITPVNTVADSPVLNVKYFAMFGGIEISN